MKFDELRSQPILLFPVPKNEVYFADKDNVWINGRQYISLKRVGEMMKENHKTNADRFRSMTDEELAELWWERVDCGECPVHKECKLTGQDCKRLAIDWLKQEAEE